MSKRKRIITTILAGILAGGIITGNGVVNNGTVYAAEGNFHDVKQGTYYYRPVYWALEHDITAGTSETTFSPEEGCTRAQTVTFLWRMAGEPEPQNMQTGFRDVKKGSFYEKAVAWAVETGVTAGKTPISFEPNAICSRSEFVTFLYRAAGKPEVNNITVNFSDVVRGSFYERSVAWAVENGVTAGTSAATFSPDETCTRAQVVSFLHRWRTTVNVLSCGAIPNDGKDDTNAFNEAIERAYNEDDIEIVYVPAGTYMISVNKAGTGIRMKSNTGLQMDSDAILDVAGNSLENYHVIEVKNADHVSISGGKISGERYKHMGTNGEWGMGIGIYDSSNVNISDMKIAGNWGDGIYLGTESYSDKLYGCDGIKIDNCIISDNRRSNISIVDASNVTIDKCLIADANGTAPQCGINIEPNKDDNDVIPDDAICRNITIKNTTVNVLGKNDYWGQFFCFMTMNYPDNSIHTADNIRISSCTFNGDCGNYSATNMIISDTVINGTFYDEQNTRLENVVYESIWKN